MGSFDEKLLWIAGRQHFVVGRGQLLDIGDAKQIEYRLRRGILERVHRSVYRIAGSPRSWRQDLLAACFAGGKLSVASFRSATRLWDLPGSTELCEVTSPRHRRARHAGVIPHESRFLQERDVTYVDNIPVTRPARTINDLGLLVETGEMTSQNLDHAMLEAVRRDLVDARQVWLSPTRWVDLDLAWPERRVFAEFDSYKWHGNRDAYMKTIARRMEIEARFGWRGVPVTDDELDAGCPLAIPFLRDLISRASADPT